MKFKLAINQNGLKVVKVKPANTRGFSVQTNGNLPRWHNERTTGFFTPDALQIQELSHYIHDYGTEREKAIFPAPVAPEC